MYANDANTLFFQVMGGSMAVLSIPSRQSFGRPGAIAKAVAIPANATPLLMTCWATALRDLPLATDSYTAAQLRLLIAQLVASQFHRPSPIPITPRLSCQVPPQESQLVCHDLLETVSAVVIEMSVGVALYFCGRNPRGGSMCRRCRCNAVFLSDYK